MDELPSSITPLCFNRLDFTKPSFHVDSFLGQTRHRVSLDQIKEDLHIYLKILQNAMIELINKDYADFVNLSSNLVSLRGTVEKLQSDLTELFVDVDQYADRLEEQTVDFNTKLVRKRQEYASQMLIQRQLLLFTGLETARRLFSLCDFDRIDVGLVERMSAVMLLIRQLADEQSDGVKKAIDAVCRNVQLAFDVCFIRELKNGSPDSRHICLQAYRSCDCIASAQRVFLLEFLDPMLLELSPENTVAVNLSKVPGALEFRRLMTALLQSFERCSLLFQTSHGASSDNDQRASLFASKFLVSCILLKLLERLDERFGFTVLSTDQDLFHECFSALCQFAKDLQNATELRASGMALIAQNSLLSACFAKFDLSVYFQMRLQDITSDLFTELRKPLCINALTKVKDAAAVSFRLQIPFLFHKTLTHLFLPSVFLPPLCDRFWEAHCHLTALVQDWVLQLRSDATLTDPSAQPLEASGLNGSAAVANLSQSASSSDLYSTATKNAAAVSSPTCPNYELATSLIADALNLIGLVRVHFTSKVAVILRDSGVKCVDSWTVALRDAILGIGNSLSQCISSQMAKVLTVGIAEVPRIYRWTRKNAPTQHLPYVAAAFAPLSSFLSSAVHFDDQQIYERVLSDCFETVLAIWSEQTQSVLASDEKISSSLSRLKKTTAKTSDQAASDSDKIRLQLQLDAKEFQRLTVSLIETVNNARKIDVKLSELANAAMTSLLSNLD